MRSIPIGEIDDPRIADYVNVRRSRAASGKAGRCGTFIVEGRLVVERLIESDYEVESLLIADGSHQELASMAGGDVPVYSMSASSISRVVGFDFHRGVLACGVRRDIPAISQLGDVASMGVLAIALMGITEQENMGSILRTAAALGIDHVLLGPRTIDPLSRRAIRVSMATALKLRFFRLENPAEELPELQRRGIRTIASTLAQDSVPIDQHARDQRSQLLLIGNEAVGIDPAIEAVVCDRVKIPMSLGVDSLNASVAAAILMYELSK